MNDLHNTITSIYDAAISPEDWGFVLDQCVNTIGAHSSTLIVMDNLSEHVLDFSSASRIFRDVPEKVAYYQKYLSHYELSGWEHINSKPSQTILTDKDSWSVEDSVLKAREDYAYLLEHANIFRKFGARLNDCASWKDYIAFQFHKDYISIPKSSMGTAQLLLPHLAKSIELGRTFSLLKEKYNAVLTALDYLDVGICIALQGGTIIARNKEAERIFFDHQELYLHHSGRLDSHEANTSTWLNTTITRCSKTATGQDNLQGGSWVMGSNSATECLILEVAPIKDTLKELDSSLFGAVIFIIDPSKISAVNIEVLKKAYKLTNSETEVCELLVGGLTNREISNIRNVSIETVKTQISHIFQKTRAGNRSELARLAFRCTPPISQSISRHE